MIAEDTHIIILSITFDLEQPLSKSRRVKKTAIAQIRAITENANSLTQLQVTVHNTYTNN